MLKAVNRLKLNPAQRGVAKWEVELFRGFGSSSSPINMALGGGETGAETKKQKTSFL